MTSLAGRCYLRGRSKNGTESSFQRDKELRISVDKKLGFRKPTDRIRNLIPSITVIIPSHTFERHLEEPSTQAVGSFLSSRSFRRKVLARDAGLPFTRPQKPKLSTNFDCRGQERRCVFGGPLGTHKSFETVIRVVVELTPPLGGNSFPSFPV